jgi:hypothetical protein
MTSAALIPQQIKDYAVGIPTCLVKKDFLQMIREVFMPALSSTMTEGKNCFLGQIRRGQSRKKAKQ